jgi:Isochorismatase family
MSGTNPELREVLPGIPEIDRISMNSWEDPDFRAAVERTGRKKLILAGLWTACAPRRCGGCQVPGAR